MRVQEAIDELVADGVERGVQVAVYRDGRLVVDAVAGLADPATGRPVTPDTPFYVYSMGKALTATTVHVLVRDGLLGYDTPLVDVWPEFGAHGKHDVTVRHVLTHSAGVPAVPPDTTPEDVCDWDGMCARIAASEPWWPAGTRTAYHAYTFGYLAGEVVRRVTGAPVSRVLRERVAAPLGVPDELWFGMPPAAQRRLAVLEDEPGGDNWLAALPDDAPMLVTAPRALLPTAGLGNRPDILAADIPSGGKVTARAAARMYAALLGPVDGVRLIPQSQLDEVAAVAMDGRDEVMGNRARWALGYAIGRPGAIQSRTAFGMAGAGGSYGWADRETGTAVAIAKNRLTGDFSTAARIAALLD